jgi:hypothetical protein
MLRISLPTGPTLEDRIGDVATFFIFIAVVVFILIAVTLIVDHGPRLYNAAVERLLDRQERQRTRKAALVIKRAQSAVALRLHRRYLQKSR